MFYKLCDWVDADQLDWGGLSMNPYAIDLLKDNPDKIDWIFIWYNPNAIELILSKLK